MPDYPAFSSPGAPPPHLAKKKVQPILQVACIRSVLTCMSIIEELLTRPGYIGVLAASKLIGRSKQTITKWINAGTFQAYRIGNANKIDRSYLADWLEAHEWPRFSPPGHGRPRRRKAPPS